MRIIETLNNDNLSYDRDIIINAKLADSEFFTQIAVYLKHYWNLSVYVDRAMCVHLRCAEGALISTIFAFWYEEYKKSSNVRSNLGFTLHLHRLETNTKDVENQIKELLNDLDSDFVL